MKNAAGQTIIEFALILLLVVSLLFGITEFGRAWFYSNALENGVRAGARYAAALPNGTSFETSVKSYTFAQITSAIPRGDMTTDYINISAYGSTPPYSPRTTFDDLSAGDAVTVIAHYDFTVLTGSIIPFFSGTKVLTKKATMRYEHD